MISKKYEMESKLKSGVNEMSWFDTCISQTVAVGSLWILSHFEEINTELLSVWLTVFVLMTIVSGIVELRK